MNLSGTWIIAAVIGSASTTASAQLEIIPNPGPQLVFAGDRREITMVWHNAGGGSLAGEMRLRLYQTSSATAAPLMDKPWKRLTLLPGQTVLESAPVDFPAVNAGTTFLIQWLTGTNQVVGKTEVLVYPTNLLAGLKPMLGKENLGLWDPEEALKPVLKQNGVSFLDLGGMTVDDFSGRLAIVGPFRSRAQMRANLPQSIERIASKGVAVIWILPPGEPKGGVKPSFYLVPKGRGRVVVVQSDLVANFSESPRSQLNLIDLCRLALNPEPLSLPDLSSQP